MICRVKNLLLSYPRSGNTWIRYFIEYVSQKPTRGCGGAIWDKYTRKVPHKLNYNSKAIMQKEHFSDECRYHNPKKDKIILLVRNPREVIVRHNGPRILQSKKLGKVINKYMNSLALYDCWSNKKLLLYYENVIDNFSIEAKKIVELLNLDKKRCKEFLSNYQYHKNICINIYSRGKGLSRTSGNKKIYHSNLVNDKLLKRIDYIIKGTYPKLHEKYLSIYN